MSGCAGRQFQSVKPEFDRSAELMKFSSIANMNDAHFVVKEHNYFEFYRLLFDSVKNSSLPGKYQRFGDTLKLSFYDKKGKRLLGSTAIVDSIGQKITFIR